MLASSPSQSVSSLLRDHNLSHSALLQGVLQFPVWDILFRRVRRVHPRSNHRSTFQGLCTVCIHHSDDAPQAASDNKVWVVGGSIPERDGDKLYNTCPIFSPTGEMVAKHRKIHLFDIDIPGKIRFVESETLSPGNSLTTFTTDFA